MKKSTHNIYLSKDLSVLEEMFEKFNAKYFDSALPNAVITIQSRPGTHGHFAPDRWSVDKDFAPEINLSAESLGRDLVRAAATLIHEMVHLYCHVNEIKDTSRGGRWHNKLFKREAEVRGLIIDKSDSIGFSLTTPAPELISWVEKNYPGYEFGKSRRDIPHLAGVAASSTRKYSCRACGTSVRATREVSIKCMDKACNTLMEIV